MTQQACVTCGTPEVRKTDPKGVESTNINPLTGECIDCLARSSRDNPRMVDDPVPFDAKQAQTGDRD